MKTKTIGRTMAAACAAAVWAGALSAEARPTREVGGAKYVFFFLGDGMGNAQIQATEAFLTQINNGNSTNPAHLRLPANRLNMSKLPVQGMQTTFDDGALNTDSASAGTAFACGAKTGSGMIGMNKAKTVNYKSVAQLAKEQGKKVGVLTSVSLDHATPAAYYASIDNRGKMNNIASQMVYTAYNFFGGGGLVAPTNANRSGDTAHDVWTLAGNQGYTIKNTRDDIMGLTNALTDKVICINPWLQDAAAMPYEIDRPETNCSLAELTRVAIKCLENNAPKGFFLMVEGGKIDWSCHANDAMATIGDMLDFDDAVAVALEFYAAHAAETLIVVTGDHETGGMTVGSAKLGYGCNYGVLTNQTVSFQAFGANEWVAYKAANSNGFDWATMDIANEADEEAKNLLANSFGLTWASLDEYEKARLEAAYDKSMAGTNSNSATHNGWLYGSFGGSGYEPIVVTATHIVNEKAGIGWTTYAHTGVPVPVYAVGFDSYRFAGFYDNTDIAKQVAAAMRITQTLPVTKP